MHEFASSGGQVRAQRDETGDYDQEFWYSITLNLDGIDIFIKFVLCPDEPSEPGIRVVSIHEQR
jgi:hypothetical protein